VALLGILKAGAAYLPLEPDYPADRLRFIIEDAGAPILVTQKTLATDFPNREETLGLCSGYAMG